MITYILIMKLVFWNIFKGIIYGLCSIIPGLSGGVISVYLGDYEKCLSAFSSIHNFVNSRNYLFSLGFGFITSVIISSSFILFLYGNYLIYFKILVFFVNIFILLSQIKKQNNIGITLYLILLSVFLFIISRSVNITFVNLNKNFLFSSFIYSISKVVPGVSGTTILINIGFYQKLLFFFSSPLVSFFKNPFFWFFFWSVFVLFSIIMIEIMRRFVNSKFFSFFLFEITFLNFMIFLF